MVKSLLFALALVLVLLIYAEAAKKGQARNNKRANGGGQQCSAWTFGECSPGGSNGTCGKGTKKGTRTGENCELKEKSFPCKGVPCPKPEKAGKNKCKYLKGAWSECDLSTNTMTRTNTLKKGDATTCQATKIITKKCKNKKTNARRNQNNRRTRKPAPADEQN